MNNSDGQPKDGRVFQILCLSGGGFLGLYTASVLRQLEEHVGEPIGCCFDLIAGTSVGGIIGLGLAYGCTAKEIERAFLENGHRIFSSKQPPKSEVGRFVATLGRLVVTTHRPRYNSKPLRDTIRQIVPADVKIGDLKSRIIVPTVNLSKGKPQVFKTSHHETFKRDWRLAVEDVALATSAAPSYFPVHQIDSELFADGGLYANSPDQLAIHEAVHFLKREIHQLKLLSVGTTSTSFSWSSATGQNLGWFEWVKKERLIRAMMAAQQVNVDYVVGHQLKDRYIRIDRAASCEQEVQLGLDVASRTAIDDLRALANASVRDAIADEKLLSMLRHRAATPHFFNGRA